MFQHQVYSSMENSISLLQPHNFVPLPLFSALSLSPSFQIKDNYTHTERRNRTSNPRSHILRSSCHGREPINTSSNLEEKKDEKQGKQSLLHVLVAFQQKLGKNMKENLSPKQKGDWKDLVLMSLSFAVYVYISQKLVCAYCAWTSMPNQTW